MQNKFAVNFGTLRQGTAIFLAIKRAGTAVKKITRRKKKEGSVKERNHSKDLTELD